MSEGERYVPARPATQKFEATAPSPDAALFKIRELIEACPDGYHPIEFHGRKRSKGRRTDVTVIVRKNKERRDEEGEREPE